MRDDVRMERLREASRIACPGCRGLAWRSIGAMTERVTITLDDQTMDKILDDLTERAGHPRNTDALGLARWDLKATLRKYHKLKGDDR